MSYSGNNSNKATKKSRFKFTKLDLNYQILRLPEVQLKNKNAIILTRDCSERINPYQ